MKERADQSGREQEASQKAGEGKEEGGVWRGWAGHGAGKYMAGQGTVGRAWQG